MAIDKIFNDANVDGIADNIFGAVNNSVSEVKQMQQRKAAENVQMVVEAFKKIETNITEKFDNVTDVIEKRVLTIKDGRDGSSGSDGRNGRDGKPGRDGVNGKQGTPGTPGKDGVDGEDGVSVTNANIDFDGSLVISLSTGQQINVGEVVAPDLAEKIKIVSTMSTNGAVGIKDEGTSITAGVKVINFVGATVTATASGDDVTVNVSAGTGTVTSVAATVPAFLSVAGSPVTTTGTLAISLSGTALPVANGGTGLTTGTSGGVLAYTASGTLASSAALAASALVIGGGAGAAPSTTTTGTGVVTALGVNTGTAGAFVVNGGALGTPSSGTLTSATGLPISTGVSGLGSNVATFLATPSSANLAAAVTNETGSGALVFATSPTLVTPALGTPASGTVTNLTGTASININGTVGATTPGTGAFTTLSATGVTTVQAGSAGAPAITTTGDTNTGIFFPAADTIAFTGGGAEAMRIDSAGNLGLGVTPSAWTGSYGIKGFNISNGAVYGATNDMNVLFNSYFNGTNFIYSTTAVATKYTQGPTGQHQWFNAASGTAGNAISFTQAMTLDASGRLQIASTNNTGANAKLVVGTGLTSADGRVVINTGDTNIDAITLDNWDGAATSYGPRISFNNSGRGGFVIGASDGANNFDICQTWGTPCARIDSSGNLLVGTTSSFSARLAVKDSTSNGTTNAIYCKNSANTILFYISSNGYFVTGTDANSPYNLTTASGSNVTIESDGVLKRSTSSLKYKTDVQNTTHGLAKVLQLRPVTYKGKNDGNKVFGGLIAEEVHEAGLTEFVQYAEDGSPDALAYGNMVSLLTKAIQEQQALIVSMRNELDALKTKVGA